MATLNIANVDEFVNMSAYISHYNNFNNNTNNQQPHVVSLVNG